MKSPLLRWISGISILILCQSFWGFHAHKTINKLAVFTLPPEMIGFYKKNIAFITESAVDPDRRRFVVEQEAPRHYIDLDHFGDSAVFTMPRFWQDAKSEYTEDTLIAYGILPWHVNRVYYQLKDAFLVGDPERILKISAEIGHYIGDAHVPLHTTENYDGQLTGQQGIHAFWESRLPELFSNEYNFFVGRASYLANPQLAIWSAIENAHAAVDSVLDMEADLSKKMNGEKYSFETKGKQTQRVYSNAYSTAYHEMLSKMVERQMRASAKMLGDFWFSAWVDAGQPDLKKLIDYKPSAAELQKRNDELNAMKEHKINSRQHEMDVD